MPCAIGLVEFPARPGVRVVSRLRGRDPEDVRVDDEVEIGFEPGPGGYAIPSFTVVARHIDVRQLWRQ